MDGAEMMGCVDATYEMDCPQFVDFSAPQHDDNADEWFNFDHENGVPVEFDDQDITDIARPEDQATVMESSAVTPKRRSLRSSQRLSQPPTNVSDQEMAEVSASSAEENVEATTDHTTEVEDMSSSDPEPTDQEEGQTTSGHEVTSSAEMSTDSLETHKTEQVPDEETQAKTKTRGSPEIAAPKKRGNIVTSFSRVADQSTASVADHASKPQPRKQRSGGIVMRKSPRLHVRRSAETAKVKRRSSLLQANKRRSASAATTSRPRSGSVDQLPTTKRRRTGNDKPAALAVGDPPAETKKSCPKVKGKMALTLPTTPTLLKRNMAKPNVHLKTTEEMEIERIAQLRNNLAEIRKKSAQSFKAVKESGPVVATHAAVKPTKVEEFKFETDSRIKSHPMETRKDSDRRDFVGNLRKYTSPAAYQGLTEMKPFTFSDSRKRSHEESFVPEKKGYEFRSTALAVSQFHTKTPERFRSRPVSEQNKGPEPSHDKPKKTKLTHPVTPALETKSRHRPVSAISMAQREEMELAEIKSYKFKARPVDPRVMNNVGIGVKTTSHKEPTKAIGFDLEIEKRLQEREAKKEHSSERYEFRARPLPAKILAGPVGVAEAKAIPATVPKSPAFALKNRVKIHEEKEREKEKESEHDNSHIIKARPILHVGVPFVPNIQHKKTEPEPFSFDGKIQESKARKEARKMEIFKEEEKARQFRAQPLPDPSCSGVPEKKVKPATQALPFNVADKAAKQAEDWSKKMEEEIRACKRLANGFKAKPANILYEEPFIPEKSTKPMTDISNFTLNTEKRAEERKGYEQTKYERQSALEAAQAQREAEQEEELRQAVAKQRAEAVHRANPVRHYKGVTVLPSTKLPTQPVTPKFSDRFRRNSHV